MIIFDSKKFQIKFSIKHIFFKKKYIKLLGLLAFGISPYILLQKQILSDTKSYQIKNENDIKNYQSNSEPKWKIIELKKKYEQVIQWEKIQDNSNRIFSNKEIINKKNSNQKNSNDGISSFNRSVVFNDSIVGPDVSWLVPPGLKWNNKYRFDASIRGHSGRFDKGRKGKSFWTLEDGDAVGQFYYQFLNNDKTSFGLNFGIRSIYSGSGLGGSTSVGEGQSLGFRLDRKISSTEGFAFGAEQLLHFDGLTDTGRDIYFTLSKAFLSNDKTGQFPIDIYTIGVATGRMAEGNIKFLCSDLLGGSATEINIQRQLCWAPVFSVSRVFNKKFSTFFEHNSKWFLLGSSIIPFNEIPLRGTFAVQLSDHIDNYKLNNFDEIKYMFRLSLGF